MSLKKPSYLDVLLNKNNNREIDVEKLYEIIQENGDNIIKVYPYQTIKTTEKTCWDSFKEIAYYLITCCNCCGCCEEEDEIEFPHFVGLKNVGNNCYLNAAIQILSRCSPFVFELLKYNYENNELLRVFSDLIVTILFKKVKDCDPTEFIECFTKLNKNFVFGRQNCSQDFIRTILRNINDSHPKKMYYDLYNAKKEDIKTYESFIQENKIFPESKAYSIFSGILKIQLYGECSNCDEKLYCSSYNSFVDQIIYLNSVSKKCYFSEVLRKNIGCENKAKIECSKCKVKNNVKSISKFVKIPEIFIFTLERYLEPNKVPIIPDETINIYDLVDKSLHIKRKDCFYELLAVNIRIGNDLSFGHEICHIKENNNWYTINDNNIRIKDEEYYESSYGLFYRRIKKEIPIYEK